MVTMKKENHSYDIFEGKKRQDVTLVWVHGTGTNKRFMEAVRPTLSAFTNVFLDLPGHGDSTVENGFTAKMDIDAISAVISHFENVVLIGHSLGAALTLAVLAKKPENVIGGVILNGAVKFDRIDSAFYQKINEGVLDLPYVLEGCGHVDHPKVKKAIAAMESEEVAIKDWLIDEHINVENLLPKIAVPVEILAGEEDPFAPVSEARVIGDGVQEGHLITIPKGRHLSFLTDDQKLTECVDRVLIKAGKAEVATSPILTALVEKVRSQLQARS
jgi:pimeloyl-ACP methyl ester carboxylesterase